MTAANPILAPGTGAQATLPALPSDVRPWGSWQVVAAGNTHQVKTLRVSPGQRLSYQTHRLRSEHWLVVQGRATCVLDGVVRHLERGDSLDVPLGSAHRLANPGPDELVVVEVQLGVYLGEDDICRLEDDFGRVTDA